MKKLAVLLFFVTTSILYTYAQAPKSFPEDDAGFINTLSTYIGSNNRPEAKESGVWLKTNLALKTTPEDLILIKSISGTMLQKKVPLWPAFYNFTNLLRTIGNQTDISADIISKNHELLQQLIQGNSPDAVKQFNFYVDYLNDHYQSKAIYKDKARSWLATENYKIEIENQLPVYVFDKMTLTGTTSGDSLQIFETSGKFYPFTNLWKSNSGKITWRRAGYNEEDVFVLFKNYELDLSKPELTLDTATFSFKPYIKETIQGKFADKLFTSKAVSAAFPQFTSFDKVPMKVSDEVILESGLGIEGNKIFATTTSRAEPARLTIYNTKKQKILTSEANKYLINNFKQINAEKAKVNFAFIDTSNSIFHPSSALSYNIEGKNLKITRENSNDARIPFVAPYFKMNLYVDQFDWKIDSNYADMNSTAANAKLPAIFESFEYYIEGADSKYQQLLNIDPIGALANYCENMDYRRLSIDEIARVWNASGYKAIEQLAFKMMEDGYLYYERETGMVDVYDKLFLHAKIRKEQDDVNFDNIRLSSITQGKVGRLLLDQKKLQIFGTDRTRITPSVNITMNPSSDTVYISENRGIVFKGRLTAGKFNFYSDSIHFDYDEYVFSLKSIDSMLIMVPSGQADSKGNPFFTEINTPIEKISGKIYIADPKQRNKSTKYTIYPYFDCNDTSIVVFDKGIHKDKYSPENFKFKIYPFQLEKMHIYDTDSIKLKGLLQSEGIFEDFEADLSITKDRTLGLDLNTEAKGLSVYNQMATLHGNLILNQDGLTTNGHIIKNNLSYYSDNFLLLPDSIGAQLSKWESVQSAGMPYPTLSGPESKLSWIPSADSAFIEPVNKSEVLAYNNLTSLTSNFYVKDDSISASGNIKLDESIFESDHIELFPETARINKTRLAISKDNNNIFTSGISDIEIDFKTMVAQIEIPADSLAKFNFNYLVTNYENYIWDINDNTVTIKDNGTSDNKYYEFVENKLKGIRLSANHSVFDEINREINLDGVTQILVADSKVIPDEARLKITNGGLIDILDSATVVLNTDSSYHTINSAQVEILNQDMMKGSGILTVNIGEYTKDVIIESFKTIEVTEGSKRKAKTTYYTQGLGQIEDADEFRLSEKLFYKGKLLFTSLDKEMSLDGYARSQFKSIPESEWFKIKQSLDLQKSTLGIDSLKSELGQDIYTGLMLDMNEFTIYPRIIQSKETSTDRPVYIASGFMKSINNDNTLLFGEEDALNKKSAFLPLMKYNDLNGDVEVTGKFPITNNIAPNVFDLYGNASYKRNSNESFTIQGTLAMDLYLTPEIKNLLTRFMNDFHVNGVYSTLTKNRNYSFAITRFLKDPQTISLVNQDMQESGILNLPPNYPMNTVFADIQLAYDKIDGTFKSVVPIQMLVFAGKPYAQKINALIEVGPRGKGDFLNIYLSTASNDWIFMRYINGELSIASSDSQVTSGISAIKEDKRILKSGKDVIYRIVAINSAIKDNFVARMEEYKSQISKP